MTSLPHPTELTLQRVERSILGPPRHKPGQLFLKGPIPQIWLSRAASLPGKSLHVGLSVWFLAGMTKSRSVRLSARVSRAFGVDRHAKYRALRWLEDAGLVTVVRRSGCSPIVTLLEYTNV
jgi:hypothetical protein